MNIPFFHKVLIGSFFLFFAYPYPSTRLESQTSNAAVARVVSKMRSLQSFEAKITIQSPSGGIIGGKLYYQQGKIHFRLNDGRVIASNGRNIIVYSPASRVAGKQEMSSGGGGLSWLLHQFNTTVKGRQAHLKAQDPNRGVQEVRLRWTENYLLQKLSIRRRNSQGWLSIDLSSITPVSNIAATRFSWRPPAGSRTVENPLNQKN